jgi:MYXO-CTERM domain-containing protein
VAESKRVWVIVAAIAILLGGLSQAGFAAIETDGVGDTPVLMGGPVVYDDGKVDPVENPPEGMIPMGMAPSVPEPTTLVVWSILGVGAAAGAAARRRRRT